MREIKLTEVGESTVLHLRQDEVLKVLPPDGCKIALKDGKAQDYIEVGSSQDIELIKEVSEGITLRTPHILKI